MKELINNLSHINTLSLLVTMRGTAAPACFHTSLTLNPLSSIHAIQLFKTVSGCSTLDIFAKWLVQAAGGLPLAVSLLASLARLGHESTEALWQRWQLKDAAVSRSPKEQKSSKKLPLNLTASIELSLDSPHIKGSPDTRLSLEMLSLLPSGITSQSSLLDLEDRLPRKHDFLASVRKLDELSLTHKISSDEGHRVLSSISDYARDHLNELIDPDTLKGFVEYYCQFASHRSEYIDPTSGTLSPGKLANLHSVVNFAMNYSPLRFSSVSSVDLDVGLRKNTESDSLELFQRVLSFENLNDLLAADCQLRIGELFLRQNRPSDAEQEFLPAAKLLAKGQSEVAEDRTEPQLGELSPPLHQADKADEQELYQSLKLHSYTRNKLGEGYDRWRLAELFMRLNRLNEAEDEIRRAIELHSYTRHKLGEGGDRKLLGQLCMQQDRLQEAEEQLLRAVELHSYIEDKVGEADDRSMLGQLRHALYLHTELQNVNGEANVRLLLGKLYTQMNRLQHAVEQLHHAVELHSNSQINFASGSGRLPLDEVYMSLGQLDEAEWKKLREAMVQHSQPRSITGKELAGSRLDELQQLLRKVLNEDSQIRDLALMLQGGSKVLEWRAGSDQDQLTKSKSEVQIFAPQDSIILPSDSP